MNEDITGKSSLPIFDGEEEKVTLWWMSFKAHGLIKSFSQALTAAKEEKIPTDADDALDLRIESKRKDHKTLGRDILSTECLTMAFVTKA